MLVLSLPADASSLPGSGPSGVEIIGDVELFGGIEKRALALEEYDERWPHIFAEHSRRIRAALTTSTSDIERSDRIEIEHIGSTSVPGLAAKPIVDIVLVVGDITAESEYLDALIAAGYVLRVREPGHRLVRTPELDVHVHIYQRGDQAVTDYLLFRDHLRVDAGDRALYENTKRTLLAQDWADMNAYSDAKTDVISKIKARARGERNLA
jgi:GrpB-like predicted nucleotidyltransferase (UPF0157 family)